MTAREKTNGTNGSGSSAPSSALALHATQLAGPTVQRDLDRDDLAEWMWLKSSPSQKSDRAVLFALSHDHEKTGRSPITHARVPKALSDEERQRAIAEGVREFARAAQNYAATFPTIQRFFVGAVASERIDADAVCEYPFLVSPPDDVAAGFYQKSEEPSASALVGHCQRLLDKVLSIHAAGVQNMLNLLADEKRDLLADNRQLSREHWDMRKQCEELLDAKAFRDVTTRKMLMDQELHQKLYMQAFKYGGALLERYLKLPASGEKHPLLQLAESLSPEQLVPFARSLDAQQQETFAPMLAHILDTMPEDKKTRMARAIEEYELAEQAKKGDAK